ncbi:MAG: TolB-like translocation protein [Candidatus Limnocylindrales bacterium]
MSTHPPNRHHATRATAPLAIALVLAAAAACGGPLPPSPTGGSGGASHSTSTSPSPVMSGQRIGLWCLCGNANTIGLIRPFDGATSVALPATSAGPVWASGDAAEGFVLTFGPAAGFVDGGPIAGIAPPRWRALGLAGLTATDAARAWTFGTVSPDGRQVAAIFGRPGTGARDARLLVADRTSGRARAVELGLEEDGRAALWLDRRTVAVPVRDPEDRPALAIVDLSTDRITTLATGAGAISAAGDVDVVAYQSRDDGRIRIGPLTAFRAGEPLAELPASGPSGRTAGQVLLDRTGVRLAVTWLDDAGDPASIAVYRLSADGWFGSGEVPLPAGTTRAVLAGFDP